MSLKNCTDRYYLVFTFIAFLILIVGLGSYGLAETSEARYAEISREMLLNGDYLNPELLGIFHFHKPPITYYITTLGYQIFGINEFGARFFLQVTIIVQLLLVYRIADLLYHNKRIALMAGSIYFSLPIVLISSKTILVYDYLLASIPFYTNDILITLKSSHSTTRREVQFENDDSYKKDLWDVHTDSVVNKLYKLSQDHSTYLLVRNIWDLSKDLTFLKNNFQAKKLFGKWTLYYNK